MDPKQHDQDIEEKLYMEKEVLIQMTEHVEQPTKITALFAKALNQGDIPMNPADYIHHIMTRVKIPTHGGVYSYTIAQFASKCKEDGINLTINSLEEIATMIATLEAEYGTDSKVGAGLILYLVVKSSDVKKRQMVDNLIWAFTMADDRKAFTEEVCWRGAAPAYLAGGYPQLAKMEFGTADWEDLFSCLIACIGGSGDPYRKFLKARTDWLTNKQEGSIQAYLYAESRLWGNLINQCRWIDRYPPSEKDRMDTLCCNLKKEFMDKLSIEVRRKDIAPRNMTLAQVVEILKEIDNQETKVFPWEATAQGATTTCPHCKKSGMKHTPEECRMNPNNIAKTIPEKRVTWGKQQTYPVDCKQEKSEEHKTDIEQSYSFVVEKKNVPNNPLFTTTLKGKCGRDIRVGFDTFSSVTLIKPGLCEKGEITNGPPIPLSGVGGERITSGKIGKIHMCLNDKIFNVTGCITDTPVGVDVLLGTPQLINLGCVIDLENRRVTFRNFFQATIPLDLIPKRQVYTCNAVALELPEMNIHVDMKTAVTPHQCTRGHTIPHRLSEKAEEEVAKEIKAGHLEEVEYSPHMWISPLFIKLKNSGGVRLLADLEILNKFVKQPAFWALLGPNRTDFLSSIKENTFFSKIDISNAFHTCPVAEASRDYLVVRFKDKLLRYRTAPQGLSTSALFWPVHLSSGFNQILGCHWGKYAKVYVDDILIMGNSRQDCKDKTLLILSALLQMGKDVSSKSVTEPSEEVECIGFLFSREGCRISDEGVSKLKKALEKKPRTMKDMRGLIGSIQYAKSIFSSCTRKSEIGEKIGELLKHVKGKKFHYSDEIAELQEWFTSNIATGTMCYPKPEPGARLVIMTDASDFGAGAALLQLKTDGDISSLDSLKEKLADAKLIDILCKPLTGAELRWHTFEKETYAIVLALKKWRSILIDLDYESEGTLQVFIASDSTVAISTFEKQQLIHENSAKKKRWAGWSEEIAHAKILNVTYLSIDGENNFLADLLSRLEERDGPQEEIWTVYSDWTAQIKAAQDCCDEVESERTELSRGADGLWRKNDRIYVPNDILLPLVKEIHQRGHYGTRETGFHFREHFYAKNLGKVVEETVKECPCYIAKAEKKTQDPIATLTGDELPWEGICIDTVGPLKPESDGFHYILTCICRTTKYIVIKPVQDIGVKSILRALKDIFEEHGYPRKIVLDNFPSFKSQLFQNFAETCGIELRYIPVHCPERNGLIERQHKVLGQLMRFYFNKCGNWVANLSEIQCRINDKTMGHAEGTRITPFSLVHRFSYRHPRMPQRRINWSYDELMNKIKQIDIYEQSQRRHRSYEVNQRVLRYCPENNPSKSAKLNFRFKRSVITTVLGKNTYECKDEDGATAVVDGRSLRKMAE